MEAFFNNIFSFPTIVFTGLLLFMCVYWVLAIIGMIDIDILDARIDLDMDGDLEGVAGLMVTLGFTGVPVTVVLTLLFLGGWAITFLIVHFFFLWGDSTLLNILVGSVVMIIAQALSIPITAFLIKPMRPIFRALNGPEVKKTFVGKSCVIKSTRVDEGFGEANIVIDGADIIIKVRANADHNLHRGDAVLIGEKIDEQSIYWVEPVQ